MASTSKGIAVVGAGYWGRNLVRNYHQLGALRFICDQSDVLRKQFNKQYPGVQTCMALNEALANKDVLGVAIATPAETHFDLAREVLLAGKHVYVEKPLVLDEAQAEELIALATRQGLILMVGHLLHYHPAVVRLKELVAAGELGRINYIYSHRLNLGKIRREENILWSFAPHDISMILSLADEQPESVIAVGGSYLHKKIADVTTTHMDFPSGLKAQIFVSWLHPIKVQQLIVVGDRKMAVFDDVRPWEEKLILYPHEIKWKNHIPVPAKADAERMPLTEVEPLAIECKHFLNCMSNGCRPITDGSEGLRVLKILNASQRSLDQQGERIILTAPGSVANGNGQTAHVLQVLPEPTLRPQKPAALPYFVHPSAVVDDKCEIGAGTKIWHFSHILSHSQIGADCNIGQNVVVGPDVCIGSQCKIQNNVSVYKGVTLEEGVFCGPSMVFTNIYNPRAEIRKMDQVRPTLVKKGATLGANSTIVCGYTIGSYAFIGAGAIITRDVPDHALVVGNPARQIGWACVCGERLPASLICGSCGRKFEKGASGIRLA